MNLNVCVKEPQASLLNSPEVRPPPYMALPEHGADKQRTHTHTPPLDVHSTPSTATVVSQCVSVDSLSLL